MFSTRPLEFTEYLILNFMVTENKFYKFQPKNICWRSYQYRYILREIFSYSRVCKIKFCNFSSLTIRNLTLFSRIFSGKLVDQENLNR